MKALKSSKKMCISCMEEHEVDVVEITEETTCKGVDLQFAAIYEYCSNTEEYIENEGMIKANDLAMKDSYREKVRLLTS